jgi:hypothetical protein
VICAPVYGEVLGLSTEVVLGPEDGLPRTCAIRCDFLTLMFKSKLTHFVSTLSSFKLAQLNRALAQALEIPSRQWGNLIRHASYFKIEFSPCLRLFTAAAPRRSVNKSKLRRRREQE